MDNQYSYSAIKAVNITDEIIVSFTNPISKEDLFKMNLFNKENVENLVIQIYDMMGKSVFFEVFTLVKGENELILPLNLAPSGMYILHTISHDKVKDFKMIIQ